MLEDESDKHEDHKPLILGINSSERKNGDTAKSLNKVLRRIQKCGGRTEIIHLVDFNLGPCERCRAGQVFWKTKRKDLCAHADDTRKLIGDVLRADGFVLATLVEWMGRAPLAAAFIAKLNALESRSLLEGKVGGLIVTYEQVESGVGNNLLGALADMGMVFPPFAVVRRGRTAKILDMAGVAGQFFLRVNPRVNAELDGMSSRLYALGENMMKLLRMVHKYGGNQLGFWV